jgi:DNA ligase D-like protein (predicted ligase)
MPKMRTTFVEPMLLLRTESLPQGSDWMYEIKLDGYRALGVKQGDKVELLSRNGNRFNERYPAIVKGLAGLPNETVIDGEIVVLDQQGKPNFNLLQNYGSGSSSLPIFYYIFDLLTLAGRDVKAEPLTKRRALLAKRILPKLGDPIRYSQTLDAELSDLILSVKAQGLEGLVAKRLSSRYEPGQRSGSWQKMRINKGQEFVIGGYTISDRNFDALIFGYYENGNLIYVARSRNGFTPPLRAELFKKFKALTIPDCPFSNLPEPKGGRWGQGLTEDKMADCRWLKPQLVAQFEFTEWTPDKHLRHSKFVALRNNKKAKEVVME